MHLVFPFKNRNQHQHWCCSGMASDKAIFVYFYQVISFILTVRPDSVVAALLSYVSILLKNHSKLNFWKSLSSSQNEWKCFVIGPLEKLSVTLRFSSGDDDCQQTWDRSIISSQVTVYPGLGSVWAHWGWDWTRSMKGCWSQTVAVGSLLASLCSKLKMAVSGQS